MSLLYSFYHNRVQGDLGAGPCSGRCLSEAECSKVVLGRLTPLAVYVVQDTTPAIQKVHNRVQKAVLDLAEKIKSHLRTACKQASSLSDQMSSSSKVITVESESQWPRKQKAMMQHMERLIQEDAEAHQQCAQASYEAQQALIQQLESHKKILQALVDSYNSLQES